MVANKNRSGATEFEAIDTTPSKWAYLASQLSFRPFPHSSSFLAFRAKIDGFGMIFAGMV
jgi:hypothetical protein